MLVAHRLHSSKGRFRTIPIEASSMKRATDSIGETRSPTFVDAFAGCGGLSLGLKRAGWKGLFAIERDQFAFETLSANFPDGAGHLSYDWPLSIERRPWDIKELLLTKRAELEALSGKVDLLAGGPPCQGFSHAGRRRPDDPRNQLFHAYLELVQVLKPSAVLLENVRGFTSSFDNRTHNGIVNFADSLREKLSETYDTVSAIIKASDLGVPQTRPRFFLIGIRKGSNILDLPLFFDTLRERAPGFLAARGLPRRPTARDAISDLEVSINGTVPCEECPGFAAIDYAGPKSSYQLAMRDGHDAKPSDTRLARHREDIKERFAAIIRASSEEGRLNVSISPELRAAHNLKKTAIRVMDPLAPAPTITSMPEDLLHYTEPRTLSVRENARLQSFPDWFVFKGKYTTGGHRRVKEVPRFTQVANAVPPLVAEQIGLCLRSYLSSSFISEFGQRSADCKKRGLVLSQQAAE